MKVFVEINQSQTTHSDREQKINEIHSFLDKQSGVRRRQLLKNFSSLLIIPESFLLFIPTHHAVSLITYFFTFIEKRETEIAVDYLPFPEKTGTLVLINAPDTPYLINSLQVLQKSKNLNFKIKTHRVLIIKRRDQEIIDLKRMDDLD